MNSVPKGLDRICKMSKYHSQYCQENMFKNQTVLRKHIVKIDFGFIKCTLTGRVLYNKLYIICNYIYIYIYIIYIYIIYIYFIYIYILYIYIYNIYIYNIYIYILTIYVYIY